MSWSRRSVISALSVTPLGLAGCGRKVAAPPPAVARPAPVFSLADAIAGDWRPRDERARDGWRHPLETLSFMGLKPGMTVVEVWPGAGWYTAILATFLHNTGGRLIAASFDMAKGLRMLGYSMRMHGVYVHAGRKTLTQWLEATKATRGGKVWLIAAGGHWLVVQGFQYACGITGQIVGLKDAPHRRARVDEVYEITQVGPAKDFSPPPKAKADPAKAKAKRLAKLHGVEIERHTDLDSKPWYVSHPSFEDSEADPYAGDHYARSWPEILERVETYIEALK